MNWFGFVIAIATLFIIGWASFGSSEANTIWATSGGLTRWAWVFC